jgi:hypothetical protein
MKVHVFAASVYSPMMSSTLRFTHTHILIGYYIIGCLHESACLGGLCVLPHDVLHPHIHTYTHTQIHTYTYTHTHTNTPIHIHIHT